MTDRAVPNLPSRDFDATVAFYGRMGFHTDHRDDEWLILTRGALQLEFFPFADLVPAESSFMASIRVDDLDGLYARILDAGVTERAIGMPRLHPPQVQPWGRRVAFLVDLDGSQLTLIENPAR